MYFSGKITHSILNFLQKSGMDTDRVLDATDIPSEFLKDPACWLEADKVEIFLNAIEKEFSGNLPGLNIIEKVGHECFELKAWGVLDSVLKMMPTPQDIFTQPQRFLSYFVSPPPPIGNLKRTEGAIQFELPISTDEFPQATEYLRAALEALPTFMNSEMASVTWQQTKLTLRWSQNQGNFFSQNQEGHNVNPEFMQNLVVALENAELELEKKNKELFERDRKMADLQIEAENLRSSLVGNRFLRPHIGEDLNEVSGEEVYERSQSLQSDVLRLNDYLARCQQLITLLVGQDRLSPQVKEAMRRVDWSFIKSEYPNIVKSACDSLDLIGNQAKLLKRMDYSQENVLKRSGVRLSNVIESAIENSKAKGVIGRHIGVDKLLFYNEEVPVYRNDFEKVITQLIEKCSASIREDRQGSICVVTRPKGRRAEIEISDTGDGIDAKEFFSSPAGSHTRSIIKMHKGNIDLRSKAGEGSTFVIELPTH